MSKQAQVGIFALLGIAAVFAVFYVISDIGTRTGGYKVGVHFKTAQGLRQGAIVNLAGVPIGAVDRVQLLPDFTTDVVLSVKPGNDIPRNSRYVIVAPITGEPTLDIVPLETGRDIATLQHEILPIDQQPQGQTPRSIAELLDQGANEVRRVDDMLAQVQRVEPQLLRDLQSTLVNANAVTTNANRSLSELTAKASSLTDQLSTTLARSGANVDALTSTLNTTAQRDSPKVDALLDQLQQTSVSFNASVDSLRQLATDPAVKNDLKSTAKNFALTSKTLAELTNDLRQVTGNPQTQLQLRAPVAQLDASSQKVDALLGQLGGTSAVNGVDAGATPLPANFPQTLPAATPLPQGGVQPGTMPAGSAAPTSASGVPGPGSTSGPRPPDSRPKKLDIAALKSRINGFTKDLVRIDFRVSELAPLRPGSYQRNDSRLLSPDRGPQSDFNLTLLPKAPTSLVVGVNDTGGPIGASYNFLLQKNTPRISYAGGILYSQAGALAKIQAARNYGFEVRAYDLRHPTLDTYVNLFPVEKLELFAGGRDVDHADRRAVFGLQLGF